jgi:hypothetical protein
MPSGDICGEETARISNDWSIVGVRPGTGSAVCADAGQISTTHQISFSEEKRDTDD